MKEMKDSLRIEKLMKHPRYIRGQVSRDAVQSYAQIMIDAKGYGPFPPIIAQPIPADHDNRKSGAEYWIVDGTHRVDAAIAAGVKEIPARVMSGLSEIESIALQLKTNASHGIRLSASAQTNAIKEMKALGATQTTIAAETGLSQPSIARILGGKQRDSETGERRPTTAGGTAGKDRKSFDFETWMKGLSRILKSYQKNGSKIRRKGFPESCVKAMDNLVSKLIENETEEKGDK